MAKSAAPQITGPKRVVVRQSSWAGPFGRRLMRMRPIRFSIVNAAATACLLHVVGPDPVQTNAAGTIVAADLSLRPVDPGAAMTIDPGGALTLELGGHLPARPGAYATAAHVLVEGGDSLTIPFSIEVPASPPWGIAAMLFGLLCLGVVNFLENEGEIWTWLHDALSARQDIHRWLEANPAPESRFGDVAEMDRDFDAAVASLAARRAVSVQDHRIADANASLAAATASADQIRRALAGRKPGAAEIEDLEHDWMELQNTLQQIALLTKASVGAPSPGLAGKLDAFLQRYRVRFLQQPMGWLSEEVTSALSRARLAYGAGEGETARDLAINTRTWLRRSVRALNTGLRGYRGARVEAGWMLGTDTTLRARLVRGDIPDSQRLSILATLDAASAKMDGDAWLAEWAEAAHQLDLAKTAMTRATAAVRASGFKAAIASVYQATDTGDIDALMERLQAAPDHSLPAKQAGLGKVLDLWRAHAAGVTDAPTRAKFDESINAIAGTVASGDLASVGPAYRGLLDLWTAWSGRLAGEARDRIDHQACLDSFNDLQHDAAGIEASLRERPAGAELDAWDRRLDQLRLDMQRRGPDAETVSSDCMTPLLDLGSRAIALSGEILTANITDLDVPALTRMRLARESGVGPAAAVTEANLQRARLLSLTPTTPSDERVTGRLLAFSIEHADPVWGAGTLLAVRFGDGSPPLFATAEQLRQGRAITHTYATPLTAHLSVVAATSFQPGGIEPDGTVLGQGATSILIAPSAISRAQSLADDFLNLRFAFALLIALVVYYWRYQTKTAIFGARSFDYVEAFALGFAANAALNTLPAVLVKMAPL
ncbi:hypothetical protein [Telmatospirillum sp.]|uniref:hypothetical protein n=1 Tax=Telmatospirillum sp. TaxID=2079197 RepID=UPI002851F8D0|nr:hypothetical protein [Telmatospirillum sp.]MDR3436047.1 hypothetical protein [Telmatospirillum sp.]